MSNKPEDQPWVPVVSSIGKPLMPCSPRRARKLLEKGKAVKRWRKGFFYIKLTEREDGDVQDVAIGIDPGAMREGYTVMSAKRTFLNINAHTADGKGIKRSMEGRRNARNARRQRKTPCRPPRFHNRKRPEGWLPPSTKARWQLKFNVVVALSRLYPITITSIEDLCIELKKGEKRRNAGFSPIQAGKNYLYNSLKEAGFKVVTYTGREVAAERARLGLVKIPNKLSNDFSAHCVDSWVLANLVLDTPHTYPDMKEVKVLIPITKVRRQLHRFNPQKGGKRPRYGGTMTEGYKKGTLIFHPTYGKTYLGGSCYPGKVSLHCYTTGKRVTRSAKLEDCRVIAHSPWTVRDTEPKASKELRVVYSKQRLCDFLMKYVTPIPRIFLELKNPTTIVG